MKNDVYASWKETSGWEKEQVAIEFKGTRFVTKVLLQ